jgi:hypothetical protein
MRARLLAAALPAATSAAFVSAGGCIDLFHSTDFATLCTFDASACAADATVLEAEPPADGTATDASPDGPLDFCRWGHNEARAQAEGACAWLGACAGPFGDNAMGPCMMHALLAYDCAINPYKRPRENAGVYWDCLARAKTCTAVLGCVFPKAPQPCAASGYTSCAGIDPGYELNLGTRVDCFLPTDGGTLAAAENCVASGKTCRKTSDGTTSFCSGAGWSSDAGCIDSGCVGTSLVACVASDAAPQGSFDDGTDCAQLGAGQCTTTSAGASCLPAGDASLCPPSADVNCTAGVATACPTGHLERYDCNHLTDGGCSAAAAVPWDYSRACASGVACAADSCEGGTVESCAAGTRFRVDCAAYGLGACAVVNDQATPGRAACGKPSGG